MTTGETWAAQQLAELLTKLSDCESVVDAERRAIEHAAEAMEAEVGVLVRDGAVHTSIGFPPGAVPTVAITAVIEEGSRGLAFAGMELDAVAVPLAGEQVAHLVLARSRPWEFDAQEANLLRAMGRVLTLSVDKLRTLAAEQE